MTFTANQIMDRALRGIGVLGIGRTMTPLESDTALYYLQELIDSWQLKRLSIYSVLRTSFTLTADTQTFTIGPSGTFVVTPKPIWLASAFVIPSGDTIEQKIDIWKRPQWLNEQNKALTDLWPRAVYMEPGATNNTLNLWPIQTTAPTLWLGMPTGLVGFADKTTQYTFPPGYHEAFRTALEEKLAIPFGKRAMLNELKEAAGLAMGNIGAENDDGPPVMSIDRAITRRSYYDITVDEEL